MSLLSTYGDTRRHRRRQTFWSVAKWTAVAGLLVAAALVSYAVGVSQARTEIVRLELDLGTMRELNRLMSERVARAEQQAEAAITRFANLQQVHRATTPRGELRDLLDLVEQRLRDGIPAGRLAFLLREARPERRCDKATETQRLAVHTPTNTAPLSSIGFAGSRISVTAEGVAARNLEGGAETWFDPSQPVVLRFLEINGDVSSIEGQLPLSHALVMGDDEYLFAMRASDRQGQIDVTMQRCDYP